MDKPGLSVDRESQLPSQYLVYVNGHKSCVGPGAVDGRKATCGGGSGDVSKGNQYFGNLQVLVAERADEKATEVGVSYDFGGIGLKGLSGAVLYARFDTPETGRNASPDKTEIDFDLKYEFGGTLEGLSLRARYAIIDEDEALKGQDFDDLRFCLQYRFCLFRN